MARNIGRNVPCPCGSGKKYKRCCGGSEKITMGDTKSPVRTARKEHRANQAAQEVDRLLIGNDLARAMASRVTNFCGQRFVLVTDPNYETSEYEVGVEGSTSRLKDVIVRLKTDTSYTRESLSHELLHLQLLSQGFPLPSGIEIKDTLAYFKDTVLDLEKEVRNLVHHELFFSDFIEMGFSCHLFSRIRPSVIDYELETERCVRDGPDSMNFSKWCAEYLCHWMSVRHMDDAQSKIWLEQVMRCGSRVHHEFPEVCDRLVNWCESREFKDKTAFPDQYNTLLALMRLPPAVNWYLVECPGGNQPIARFLQV